MPSEWLEGIDRGKALGYRRGKWKPRAQSPIAIIWHTTGAGPARRFKSRPDKYSSPFDAAVKIYSGMMNAGPHFVVGQAGELIQLAPLGVTAWHVGSRLGRKYRSNRWAKGHRYEWWLNRWVPEGVLSPMELAGGGLWNGWSCNRNTVGVEVVPPAHRANAEWSEKCWDTVSFLCLSLHKELGIRIDPQYQLGHSDAHPLSRTNPRGVGWDPHPNAWNPRRHCAKVLQRPC